MDKKHIFKNDFVFVDGKPEYEFQMKKKSHHWLWILLSVLFLLLCCVRCDRDITVTAVDNVSGDTLSDVEVTLSHTDYFIYSGGHFFGSKHTELKAKTDGDGNAVFEDMPCSVFSYIFCCLSKAEYTAESTCYHLDPSPETSLFHYTWDKTLKMVPNTSDITWHVYDKETNEPLAGANMLYEYSLSGATKTDSIKTDAAGKCVLTGIPSCGVVTIKKVSCYGYEEAATEEVSVPDVLTNTDLAKTELVPLKESFTFFVKNANTKQPVPGATVEVTLKSPNGKSMRGQAQTNVDGQGRGAYDDAFVLADIHLDATKTHYKPGSWKPKDEKDRQVLRFKELPDSARVIYLEPEPYMEEFQNVDSLTNKPIVGVENKITITSNGKESTITEISNRNGVFYVNAREGDAISIASTHEFYGPKETTIASFEKGQIIKMYPKQVSLTFRTVDAEDGSLLGDCTLEITTSRSNVIDPHNSGNGEFTVQGLYVDETISIIASKYTATEDYGSNAHTINKISVADLMNASQSKRDIPLQREDEILPCDGGSSVPKQTGEAVHVRTYRMNKRGANTTIDLDFYGEPDYLTVYDGPNASSPVIYKRTLLDHEHNIAIDYTGVTITVKIETSDEKKSSWEYQVNCPD